MIWEKATAWKLWGTTVTIIHSSPLSHCQFLWQFCQCPTTFTFPFWVRHNTCTHTHTFSLLIHSLLESLSLSHTHTHTHSLSYAHTHTLSHTHTLFLLYTHSLSLCLSLTHTLSLCHALSQTTTHTLPCSHTHKHAHTHTNYTPNTYVHTGDVHRGWDKEGRKSRQTGRKWEKKGKEGKADQWPTDLLTCCHPPLLRWCRWEFHTPLVQQRNVHISRKSSTQSIQVKQLKQGKGGLVLCVKSHQGEKKHTVNTGKTTQARNGWASFMCKITSAEKAAHSQHR